MAQNNHHTTPAPVPAALLAERRKAWHEFTRGMFWNAIAAAAVLVVLLLVFKVF
jgi:hypothetical protein